MTIEVHLENFDGPLDLLLHLIKTNEMDIYDIQMVSITEQYLTIIEQMKQLDLDVAGEFLLMAATLIHIKSRLLLPASEELVEEDEDPRAELIRRLLEYQRYKDAALALDRLPQLGQDVFVGDFLPMEILNDSSDEDISVGVYQLANAFHQLLKQVPTEVFHEVIREPLSVAEYVQIVLNRLTSEKRLAFRDFFLNKPSRIEVVVTFLAMLELVKMRLIKCEQIAALGEIWLSLAAPVPKLPDIDLGEETLGYG